VHAAEVRHHLLGSGFDGGAIGNVERKRQYVGAEIEQFLFGREEGTFGDIRDGQLHAAFGERLCHAEADATGGTGDEDNFIGKARIVDRDVNGPPLCIF